MPSRNKKSSPDDDAPESPIAFHACSNGEAPPVPRTARDDLAERTYRDLVDEKSRRLGLSRRAFTESACGMAGALFVLNQVYGCNHSGKSAGYPRDASSDNGHAGNDARYDVDRDALEDQAKADAILSGDEFIFDVQVHTRVAKPPWAPNICSVDDPMVCPSTFIREIFVGSDTQVACLSGFPAPRASDQPSIETRGRIKQIVDEISGSPRLLIHSNVRPSEGQVERDFMEQDLKSFPVAAWKVYPEDRGLDTDDVGLPFLERARQLGVKIVAAHRGISGTGAWAEPGSPRDLVAAAAQYRDINFLVYHAGWQNSVREDHAFDPANPAPQGVDRLLKALQDQGIGSDGNVYAELGSTWYSLMRDPVQAAHLLGKLLKHLGPDRILWGTDCVLNGSPQEQIAAFRRFSIPVEMQDQFGYPALTDAVKRKIFGLNAARVYGVDVAVVRRKITNDDIAKIKLARREDPDSLPIPRSRGPRTLREYYAYLRATGTAG